MSRLEVTLAGTVSMRRGSRESADRAFRSRQLQLVTAMLVMERSHPVTVDVLAGQVWPGGLPDQWRPALRGLVSRLRRVLVDLGLPPEAITSVGGAYRLELEDVQVDLEEATLGVASARAALDDDRPSDGRESANRARAVLSRPVLPGVDAPWLDSLRDSLDGRLLDVLLVLAICRSQLGRHVEARTVLAEAIDREPLREDAWRALMQVELAAGNAAGALDAYERCRSSLAERLGVDPSEQTQRLHRVVLAAIPEPPTPSLRIGERGPADADRPVVPAVASCPYVGLRAFHLDEAELFFGRTAEVQDLVARLARHGIVAVVGPSGVGKSSLVRAGLLPALARGAIPDSDMWLPLVVEPGASPLKTLAAELGAVTDDLTDVEVATMLAAGEDGLHDVAEQVLSGREPAARLVIVIDQLEELFTMGERDRAERLVALVASAARRVDGRVVVVLTLRADFVDAAAQVPGMAELLTRVPYVVPPLAGEQVEEVVVGPARRAGLELEPGLLATILTDVAGQPGALPLLQHLLRELWERRVGTGLTRGAYADLGGVAGALANRAEAVYSALGDDDRSIARRLLLRGVQPGEDGADAKRPVRESEWARPGDDQEGLETVLGRLVDARLVIAERDAASGERVVELAHEALIDGWPRLRAWVDEARGWLLQQRRMTAAADEWVRHGRHEDWLLAGLRLDEAHELLLAEGRGEVDLHLSPTERELVVDSLAAREQEEAAATAQHVREERHEARRLRRLRVLAATVTSLAVAAVVAGGFAWQARTDAITSRNEAADNQVAAEGAAREAEAARADADVERLTALSNAQIDTQRDVAILLALEAVRQRPEAATHTALHRAIAADERLVGIHPPILGGTSTMTLAGNSRFGVAWSQDGEEGRFQFAEVPAGTPVSDVIETPGGIGAVAVAGDGSLAAIATNEPAIRLYTPDGQSTVIATEFRTNSTRDPWLTVSDDGDRTAWNQEQQAVHVHDRSSGKIVRSVATNDDWPFLGPVAISPDGSRIVLARSVHPIIGPGEPPPSGRSRLEVHDVGSGDVVARSDIVELNPISIAIADDGTVMAGFREGVPALWHSNDETEAIQLAPHDGLVIGVGISAAGTAVSVSEDATAQLWMPDGRPTGMRVALQGEANQVGFAGNETLLIAQLDGTTLEVDLRGSALATASIQVDEPLRYTSAGFPWLETFPEGLSGYRLRSFEDGSIVRDVDLSADFPEGISTFSWWGSRSRNGEWTLRFGLDAQGRPIMGVVNTDGSIRRMLAMDPGRELAGDRSDYRGIFGRPSNDGDRLLVIAILSGDSQMQLPAESRAGWVDTHTGDVVAGPITIRALSGETNESVVFDDGTAVVGDRTGALLVLPPDLVGEPFEVPGGTGFNALDINEDTRRVLVGSGDGRVGMVDVDTGELEVHATFDDFPLFGSISPDGRRALVHFTNSGAQLVDLVEQAPLGVTILEGVYNGEAHWTDDSAAFWATDDDQGVSKYSADPEQWVEIACGIVHRELTAEEWHRYVDPASDPVPACP